MAKVSWQFHSIPYYSDTSVVTALQNNPVEMTILEGQPEVSEYKLNNLTTKVVFRKKAGDPRLIRDHKIQLTYSKMKKQYFDILNTYCRYWGQSLYIKLWQFDARYDSVNADETGAVLCWANDIQHGAFSECFAPYRNLSNDPEDVAKTKVWVNGVEQTTGFTIDYADGKITFPDELYDTDIVRMHFVWKPKIRILSLDPRALPGQAYGDQRYTPIVVLREL